MFETPVPQLVNRLFEDYDHNRNGVIELDKRRSAPEPKDLASAHQAARDWARHGDETGSHYRVQSHYQTDGVQFSFSRTSHHKLFKAADQNNDGKLTKPELEAFISKQFDANQDGQLDGGASTVSCFIGPCNVPFGEVDRFSDAFPEEHEQTTRFVAD